MEWLHFLSVVTISFPPQVAVAPNGIWKMTFHTPDPKVMLLTDAQRAGYGAMMTQTRLVIRSPYNMAETYSVEVIITGLSNFLCSLPCYHDILVRTHHVTNTFSHQVAGVPMEVVSVSTYYKLGSLIVDSAAACPTGTYAF